VDALVNVALHEGWRVTVVTDRSVIGRTEVAAGWTGRASVRSAEDDWRATPVGRATVAAGVARLAVRGRRLPSPDERRRAGGSRAIPFIQAYWSGPGRELLASADLVHAVGKPKPFVTTAIAAGSRAGVAIAYSEVAQVTAAYAHRPDLAGFADVANRIDLLLAFYDEQVTDIRSQFGYRGPAVRVEQWADRLEDDLLALPESPDPSVETEERPVVVGALGRLSPEKGLLTLVEGFAAATSAEPRLRLRIAGTGPAGPALAERITQLGVADRVDLLGFVADRVAFYGGIDVFVVASDEEGGPITGVEAMAAGRAVVSTSAGAMRERIRPEIDGLRFEPGDAATLADHLVALARAPARRAALAAAARLRYRERCQASVTIPLLTRAWDSLAPG